MGTSHMPRFNFSYSSYYGCLNNHQTLYSFIQKLFCSLIYSRARVGVSSLFLFHSSFGWGDSQSLSASILWRLILTHAWHLGWKDSAAGLRHCLYLLWNYHMVSFSKLLQVSQTLKHWGTEGARWKSNGHLWPTFKSARFYLLEASYEGCPICKGRKIKFYLLEQKCQKHC